MNPFFIAILAFVISVSTGSPALAAERIALVVGNSAYRNVPELPNPTRDASDVAAALERLRFRVTQLQNATAVEMKDAIVALGDSANGAEMVVVFYAGHGIEANGENWLIPVDSKLATEADAPNEAVSLRLINASVGRARQLGLVILDACRDNPFAQSIRPVSSNSPTSTDDRVVLTRSVQKGLAPTEPAANVLVAFAAKDGTVAIDGAGRNSPFTKALLANIEVQGLEIGSLFRKVRDEVMKSTRDKQQPYVYGSLSNASIYLKPPEPDVVKAFDGLWDLRLVCDSVGSQLGWSSHLFTTVKNGVLVGQTGIVGKPGFLSYDGTVDADGIIRVTVSGLTGDPKHTLGAPPPGSPTIWRAAGKLENSSGKAIRTEGRRCVFEFSKLQLGKPGSSPKKRM